MDVEITSADLPPQRDRFGRWATALRDLEPFWREAFLPVFLGDVQENFDTGGELVGGWPPLNPGYAAWKAARWGSHLGILELSLRLRGSLQWLSSGSGGDIGPEGVLRLGPTSAQVGTSVPYARKHHLGEEGLERRPILFSRTADAYAPVWQAWVLGRWEATREA